MVPDLGRFRKRTAKGTARGNALSGERATSCDFVVIVK